MMPILKRRAAKYVKGGFSECYVCTERPEEIHHTSYYPEECVAVCTTCHGHIHSDDYSGHLEPDQPRPDDYEKQRRRAEERGDGYSDHDEGNAVWTYIRNRSSLQAKADARRAEEVADL